VRETQFKLDDWIKEGLGPFRGVTGAKSYNRVVWVYAAINTIAKAMKVPYLKILSDGQEIEENHPAHRLFHPPDPPLYPSWGFLAEAFAINLGLHGKGLLVFDRWVDRGEGSWPTVVTPIDPGKVSPILQDGEIAGWEYWVGRRRINIPPEVVLYLRKHNPWDPVEGLSALQAVRAAVEGQLSVDAWNSSFFITGGSPLAVVEAAKSISAKQKKELKREWAKAITGIEKGRGFFILDNGLKMVKSHWTPKDAEFMNTKKMTREEILAALGVPPALVGVFEYANYANSREQIRLFWENTVIPELMAFQDALTGWLQTLDPSLSVEFDLSPVGVLREKLSEKLEAAEKMFQIGVPINVINERLDLGLPELEGGDVGYIQGQPVFTYTPEAELVEGEETPPSLPEEEPAPALEPGLSLKSLSLEDLERAYHQALVRYVMEPSEGRIKDLVRRFFEQMLRRIRLDIARQGQVVHQDPHVWQSLYRELVSPLLWRTWILGAQLVDQEIAKGLQELLINWKLPTGIVDPEEWFGPDEWPVVQEAFEQMMIRQLETVRTSINQVNTVFSQSLAQGLSVQQITQELANVLQRSYARTLTIARTSVGAALNGGRYHRMISHRVERHKWVAMMDHATRETHAMENSHIQKVGEPFPVTGLRFPHDPLGRAEEVVNCRCTTIAVQGSPTRQLEGVEQTGRKELLARARELKSKFNEVGLIAEGEGLEELLSELEKMDTKDLAEFIKLAENDFILPAMRTETGEKVSFRVMTWDWGDPQKIRELQEPISSKEKDLARKFFFEGKGQELPSQQVEEVFRPFLNWVAHTQTGNAYTGVLVRWVEEKCPSLLKTPMRPVEIWLGNNRFAPFGPTGEGLDRFARAKSLYQEVLKERAGELKTWISMAYEGVIQRGVSMRALPRSLKQGDRFVVGYSSFGPDEKGFTKSYRLVLHAEDLSDEWLVENTMFHKLRGMDGFGFFRYSHEEEIVLRGSFEVVKVESKGNTTFIHIKPTKEEIPLFKFKGRVVYLADDADQQVFKLVGRLWVDSLSKDEKESLVEQYGSLPQAFSSLFDPQVSREVDELVASGRIWEEPWSELAREVWEQVKSG